MSTIASVSIRIVEGSTSDHYCPFTDLFHRLHQNRIGLDGRPTPCRPRGALPRHRLTGTCCRFGTNLNLDKLWGPVSIDRRHIFTLSGRVELPKTHGVNLSATMRYMSGAPFTIQDSSVDADRNGEFFDPLPAGTYSGGAPGALQNVKYNGGVNGAYGPNFFQTDLRITYRQRLGEQRTLDFMTEIYNLTNYANFNNPSGDRRVNDSFLRPLTLRGSGFPRQAQFGVRLAF